MRLILLGGPGAGKGTQAVKMREYYHIPHISTGEVLREARILGTELGKKAAKYLDAGKLLPDEIMLDIIGDKMNDLQQGFLFDGFPRTISQAEGLDRMLKERTESLDAVVSIETPDEVVVERLLKRAEIEGRADDNRDTINHRLEVYHMQTEPLKDYYRERGLLKSVDGVGTVDGVFSRIISALGGPA